MSVYIESVILDNFFVTLLLGKLSYRALSISNGRLRQFLAALLGTAVAVLYPLLKVQTAWLVAIKFALAAVLVMILFCKKHKLLPAASIFLALTFGFGGALFALGYFVYADIDTALCVPVSFLPVGLIIFVSLTLYFFYRKITAKWKRIRDACGYTCAAEIEIAGAKISCNAFLDTGNRLYDPKSGLPVLVLGAKPTLRILADEDITAVLLGKLPKKFGDAHYIPFASAGQKNGKLLVVKPKAVRFYFGQSLHTIKEVQIGLSLLNFSDAVDYDLLLHPAVVPQKSTKKIQKGSVS